MVSVRACPTHGVVLASGICPEFYLCRFLCPAFPVSRFLCPFTFGLFWPSDLAYATYTIPTDISGRVTLCMQRIPYPCTKFPAAVAAGTAQQAWAPTFDMKTCNEFQPFPRMYPHDGWCLFPARYVQVNNTRCTSCSIHQSHKSMQRLVLNSQPGLRKS